MRTNNTEAYKDVDWFRAVADVQPYSLPIANGIGGLYGIFDYDQARVGGDYTINRSTDKTVNTDAKFSYTNVASYVDNDGTLTLGTASKLAADRTTGAQIYRVGEDAANAAGCNIPVYTHGTEAYLKSEYVRLGAAGTTDTDANNWFATYIGYDPANNNAPTGLYRQGNGIYPVYAEDYVQLDLSKADMGQALGADDLVVKPGIRHFHIDDNYDVLYNANSNSYVDATIDTEFYIVIPGNQSSILYRVGYDNLPNIMVKDIRAAYAVAHNTRADSDGQDYWVADVIVIETTKETLNYDSISLVYYNPYEQNNYTRYADTLNNEWRTLQPDYENKAMMGITPNYGFAQNGWGNSSWSSSAESNYGFWALYRTELTQPGQLSVGSVGKITEDYNNYGIYAGVATRIEDLQTSAYIDVNVRKTGCVQTYAIDVDYGESTEVPFYRIHPNYNAAYGAIYTAEQINANRTLNLSDVKDGDELIWVYNKDQNRIAFVVDLGDRTPAEMGNSTGYAAPTWLTTLYGAILAEETPVAPEVTKTAKELIEAAKAALNGGSPDAIRTALNDLTAALQPGSGIFFTAEQLAEVGTINDAASNADGATLIAQLKYALQGVAADELDEAKEAAKEALNTWAASLEETVPADMVGGSGVGCYDQTTWLTQTTPANPDSTTAADALADAEAAIDDATDETDVAAALFEGKVTISQTLNVALLNNLARLVGGVPAPTPNVAPSGDAPNMVWTDAVTTTQGAAKYWNATIAAAWTTAWNALNRATVTAVNTIATDANAVDTWRDTSIAAYETAFNAIYPELQKEVLNKITITDGATPANAIKIVDGKFTVVNGVEKIAITGAASTTLAVITMDGATVDGIGYTEAMAVDGTTTEVALNVGPAPTVYVAYTVGSAQCVIEISVERAEPVAP